MSNFLVYLVSDFAFYAVLTTRWRIVQCFVIVITFYSPSCIGQETAKVPFGLRVKLPPVYHINKLSQIFSLKQIIAVSWPNLSPDF